MTYEYDGLDEHEDEYTGDGERLCEGCGMQAEVDFEGLCVCCHKDYHEYIH